MLTSCSFQDKSEPVNIDTTVTLDDQTGQIVLPYDRYTATEPESVLLATAMQVEAIECARPQGVAFMAQSIDDNPIHLSETLLGPWTLAQAEKFGFVLPMSDADLRANQIVPEGYGEPSTNDPRVLEVNSKISEDDQMVLGECYTEPAAKRFELSRIAPAGPWVEGIDAITGSIAEDSQVQDALEDLGSCLSSNGLKAMADHPAFPEGAKVDAINEEQIRLAIVTVECKQSVDFTRRVAERWAALQAPILEKYGQELVAQEGELRQALSDAEETVRDNPEAFLPPDAGQH